MIYNEYLGHDLSRLGFGCMRFAADPSTGEIDQAKVDAMFDLAIKGGVNYFDTAYPYLNGNSEIAMAKALARYPRESYYIADKFPGHSLPGPIDNIALFNVSLKKCNTDYFDFYLLHNINELSITVYEDPAYHIIDDMIEMRRQGKIHHLGFSYHGGAALLDEFLNRHKGIFEFVQIQCNYLDWTLQNAKEKYEIITRHGLGVWIMEPVRGGKLANLSESQSAQLKALDPGVSSASWAFRFLQQLPGVKMILSGMNETDQVEDNLKTFASPRVLTQAELDTLAEIAEGLKKGVPCTACRYCCAGCPMGLDIPYLIECYNSNAVAVQIISSMRIDALPEEKRPAACVACGQCTHACPQGIDVPDVLAKLAKMYAENPKWHEISAGRVDSIRKDLNM